MIQETRNDFEILKDGKYVYFDNAATTQRPRQVLDAIRKFDETTNSNPLRGLYQWSIGATEEYEEARKTAASFIHAESPNEIIFTRNTTESLNLLAYSYGLSQLKPGDEIVISIMEHHSNILPWQMVARQTGAKLVFMECNDEGILTDEEIQKCITDRAKIVSCVDVSNVLGIRNPIRKISDYAHSRGAVMIVDAAQSAPHVPVNVTELGADFLAFSGHKLCAPMGIGVLYGKKNLLEKMPPFLSGGEMIEYVTRESATYAPVPTKFEAGTVNASGAVGLAAAIRYIQGIGFDKIMEQEEKLTSLLMDGLKKIPFITIYGSDDSKQHSGIVTFNIEGCHPHDVASVLDSENICIRAGHHCAQPLLKFLNVNATARASVYFYNTEEEVQRFLTAVAKVRSWMGYQD